MVSVFQLPFRQFVNPTFPYWGLLWDRIATIEIADPWVCIVCFAISALEEAAYRKDVPCAWLSKVMPTNLFKCCSRPAYCTLPNIIAPGPINKDTIMMTA